MKIKIVPRRDLAFSYINGLAKRCYIVIFMDQNKKVREYINKHCGLDLELNRINLIEAVSELEGSTFWNNISDLKNVPMYYFNNGTLISYQD